MKWDLKRPIKCCCTWGWVNKDMRCVNFWRKFWRCCFTIWSVPFIAPCYLPKPRMPPGRVDDDDLGSNRIGWMPPNRYVSQPEMCNCGLYVHTELQARNLRRNGHVRLFQQTSTMVCSIPHTDRTHTHPLLMQTSFVRKWLRLPRVCFNMHCASSKSRIVPQNYSAKLLANK
jgi:hypothetical protein